MATARAPLGVLSTNAAATTPVAPSLKVPADVIDEAEPAVEASPAPPTPATPTPATPALAKSFLESAADDAASLLLWHDVTRSGLVCALGLATILAAAHARQPTAAVVCYLLLAHLAVNFVRAIFARSAPAPPAAATPEDFAWLASLAAAVSTAGRRMHHGLFSGACPATALRVTAGLWVAAQVLTVLSLYMTLSIAFVAAFTLPVLHRRYAAAAGEALAAARAAAEAQFLALTRPQQAAACVAGTVVAFSAAPPVTKLVLAFLMLAGFRLYQQSHAEEVARGIEFVASRTRRASMGAKALLAGLVTPSKTKKI